jgi:hypothetical protein
VLLEIGVGISQYNTTGGIYIGERVKDMTELVRDQILWLEVAGIDGLLRRSAYSIQKPNIVQNSPSQRSSRLFEDQ